MGLWCAWPLYVVTRVLCGWLVWWLSTLHLTAWHGQSKLGEGYLVVLWMVQLLYTSGVDGKFLLVPALCQAWRHLPTPSAHLFPPLLLPQRCRCAARATR